MGSVFLKPFRQQVAVVHGHILWSRSVIAPTNVMIVLGPDAHPTS
jgi:hypothetical protein